MRRMTTLSRRQIGAALLGGTFTGLLLYEVASAHDGPHYHQVTIKKFAFTPARLTVREGDSVEFRNEDISPHTATDNKARWDTGEITKGGSTHITFTDTGIYRYHCDFHPDMAADIIVSAI